jgi:hypothetical protein
LEDRNRATDSIKILDAGTGPKYLLQYNLEPGTINTHQADVEIKMSASIHGDEMKPVVVAFTAYAGSGKTTAARYLAERHGFKCLSFSAPIKRVAMDVMDFTEEQVYGSTALKETVDPRYGISPRTFQQRLGVTMRDCVGPDIWIRPVVDTILADGPSRRFVIDDLRFDNEFSELMRLDTDGLAHVVIVGIVAETRTSTDDGTDPTEADISSLYLASHIKLKNYMDGTEQFFIDIDDALDTHFRSILTQDDNG